MAQTYEANFQFEPLVVKPGEMVSANVKFPLNAAKGATTPLEIPFSSVDVNGKKISFRLCVDVSFTTPSVEYGVETVSEFEDELDRDVMGWLITKGDKRKEHRPVQLVKRSTVVFFD